MTGELGSEGMSVYISRDAAIKSVKKHSGDENAIIASIVCIPAADAREVKRGKWKLEEEDFYSIFICSECGDTCYWSANFCPNCGADMREKQT